MAVEAEAYQGKKMCIRDRAGPPEDGGNADPSLKGLSFLTIQVTIIAVCVTIKLRAVIAGEDYDGVIGESGFLQDIQKLTDSFIHAGDHSVQSRQSGIKAFPERCGIFFRALEGKVRRVIGGMEEKGLLSVLADKTDGFLSLIHILLHRRNQDGRKLIIVSWMVCLNGFITIRVL